MLLEYCWLLWLVNYNHWIQMFLSDKMFRLQKIKISLDVFKPLAFGLFNVMKLHKHWPFDNGSS